MQRYDLVEECHRSCGEAVWEKNMETEEAGDWVEYRDAALASSHAFSVAAHAGQVRKNSGIPYHTHPLAVRQLLIDHVPDVTLDMLIAADLHDVVEDTNVDLQTIENLFGNNVANLVHGMTKLVYDGRFNRKDKFTCEVVRLSTTSKEVKTIKLADSIHNMLDYIAQDPKYAREVYIPEKRVLIDTALREGDIVLWNMADKIINDFYRSYKNSPN